MDHDEIVELISDELVEQLDGIERENLDPELSFREYGANSLDLIEVVTSVMRDLDIKIPRSELADIETIDGLAEEFAQHVD
ncbi:MAG: phosphopantetheine-binding protein [Bradymonadaceae bacterium]